MPLWMSWVAGWNVIRLGKKRGSSTPYVQPLAREVQVVNLVNPYVQPLAREVQVVNLYVQDEPIEEEDWPETSSLEDEAWVTDSKDVSKDFPLRGIEEQCNIGLAIFVFKVFAISARWVDCSVGRIVYFDFRLIFLILGIEIH